MSKLIKTIFDCETGTIIEREMTADEVAQYEADRVEFDATQAAILAKAQNKAALLNRLGITADEAVLLLS